MDVIFLHGLCSDMSGTKARALEQRAQQHGFGYLCYDARGHGSSSDKFEDTDISHWYQDALAAMSLAPCKRHILVGSSFGGWQALHLAVEQPQQVAGLVLVAPALDITQQFWRALSEEQQQQAQQTGRVSLDSNYMDDGQIMVKLQFFEAAKPFLLLDKLQQLQVSCPVRILHGVQDDTVPVATSEQLFEQLPARDMALTLVKDGDHRLSSKHDLQLLLSTVSDVLQHVAG